MYVTQDDMIRLHLTQHDIIQLQGNYEVSNCQWPTKCCLFMLICSLSMCLLYINANHLKYKWLLSYYIWVWSRTRNFRVFTRTGPDPESTYLYVQTGNWSGPDRTGTIGLLLFFGPYRIMNSPTSSCYVDEMNYVFF